MAHVVYYSEGAQTIRTVPMRGSRAVVVASGTFALKDLRYSEDSAQHLLDSGSVTLDTVNTTLTAAAGRSTTDPFQLSVTSATGITAGRRYLLRSGGREELVTVEAVSNTTVRLRHEVRQPFASGSLFLGVEVSCAVPTSVTGDEDYLGKSLAVRWDLGDLPPFVETLHLERASTLSAAVSRSDVLSMDPRLGSYDGNELTLDQAIFQAQQDLRTDLLCADLDDSAYLTGAIGKQAIMHGAAYHILKHVATDHGVRLADYYRGRSSELRANLIAGLQKAKTAKLNEDGSAKAGPDYHSLFAVQW